MALLDAAATGDISGLKSALEDTTCDVDQQNEVCLPLPTVHFSFLPHTQRVAE